MASDRNDQAAHSRKDAAVAIKYMAVKAGIFIALPMIIAAGVAIWVLQ